MAVLIEDVNFLNFSFFSRITMQERSALLSSAGFFVFFSWFLKAKP